MISPGATSTAFSGLDDYFFRTIPPDTVQGVVMGDLIAQDGIKNLAIAVFNDEYGISLRAEVLKTLKEGGVNVVYGETETFDPAENNFSSIATNIKATNPDAVLVIAADQTIPLVKELAAKGIDTHKLYMPDSNMVDHSKDFTSGLLKMCIRDSHTGGQRHRGADRGEARRHEGQSEQIAHDDRRSAQDTRRRGREDHGRQTGCLLYTSRCV